eukprot:NODE_136_length_16465_cov_1.184957.p5 type:complete len:477 gc:universal NODE_136_length_16465_cov_1.184957:13781-12351(-)
MDEKIVNLLKNNEEVNSVDIGASQKDIKAALDSLMSKEYVTYKTINKLVNKLTAEGVEMANNGSHELRFYNALKLVGGNSDFDKLNLPKSILQIGKSKALSAKWVSLNGKVASIIQSDVVDEVGIICKKVQSGDELTLDQLKIVKKRKLILQEKEISYIIKKGKEYSSEIKQFETDLTVDLLQDWESKHFKPYNFKSLGVPPTSGHLHPLLKMRTEFRKIFFELGFEEMPTNQYVESSFWNFDTLFQAQQHPARDMHDTFFLHSPKTSSDLPNDLVEKVKKVHSLGDFGSLGYGYDWKREEAEKLLLRTHTTAVSVQMLHRLAKDFHPAKYFSIDRVYRNETPDATHLSEFHQVEGVIVDKNLTLGHLIKFMEMFFEKLGVSPLRFKPTYNPYTEPSMEIFTWHEGLNTWVEVGNSGMFRPEMLLPLGLPEDVRVIAWGLSLERPAMIKYKCSNIRELVGHKQSLDMIENNPICQL